jgi:hypothetical protein
MINIQKGAISGGNGRREWPWMQRTLPEMKQRIQIGGFVAQTGDLGSFFGQNRHLH